MIFGVLALTIHVCNAESIHAVGCAECGSIGGSCDQAFEGTPKICCGMTHCCPLNTFCIKCGVEFQCSNSLHGRCDDAPDPFTKSGTIFATLYTMLSCVFFLLFLSVAHGVYRCLMTCPYFRSVPEMGATTEYHRHRHTQDGQLAPCQPSYRPHEDASNAPPHATQNDGTTTGLKVWDTDLESVLDESLDEPPTYREATNSDIKADPGLQ